MKIRYLDRLLSKKHDELVYSEIGLLQEGYRAFFKYKKVFRFLFVSENFERSKFIDEWVNS